jgi:hypothetical protein
MTGAVVSRDTKIAKVGMYFAMEHSVDPKVMIQFCMLIANANTRSLEGLLIFSWGNNPTLRTVREIFPASFEWVRQELIGRLKREKLIAKNHKVYVSK